MGIQNNDGQLTLIPYVGFNHKLLKMWLILSSLLFVVMLAVNSRCLVLIYFHRNRDVNQLLVLLNALVVVGSFVTLLMLLSALALERKLKLTECQFSGEKGDVRIRVALDGVASFICQRYRPHHFRWATKNVHLIVDGAVLFSGPLTSAQGIPEADYAWSFSLPISPEKPNVAVVVGKVKFIHDGFSVIGP
jgi:hypothetical protein